MEEFIRTQVKALQASPARPPRPVSCLVVEEVAKRCVASHAGVEAGDLLAFVDGTPASRLNPSLYTQRSARRLYSFHSRSRGEQVELATTGIEIGVKLKPTPEAIKARFQPQDGNPSELEHLFEAEEYATLLELSRAALQFPENQESPVLLFEGVGLYETGQHQEGLDRIHHYLTKYGRNWTMNFMAIGLLYLALDKLRVGEKEVAIEALERAFEYCPIPRAAEVLGDVTGVRPPLKTPRFIGQHFPCDYTLDILEGEGGSVSLAKTLRSMPHEQLLVVCVLCSYRSNGPYADFLMRYHNFASYFAPFLFGLHVITEHPERYPNRDYHYAREAEVRSLPVPFALLNDPQALLSSSLAPHGSPFLLVLDRTGAIVYEGDELSSVEWWDTLHSVSAG